jgi:hypothetical protein
VSGRAKNHHIVPQVLQRQFAIPDDPKRIWRDKKNKGGLFETLEPKLIEKAFVRRDFYTILPKEH